MDINSLDLRDLVEKQTLSGMCAAEVPGLVENLKTCKSEKLISLHNVKVSSKS